MRPVDEAPLPAAGQFRPESIRGVEGFFRVGQDSGGRWWLIDPAGARFWARGVHGVRAVAASDGPQSISPALLLRRTGFNAAGIGGDDTGHDDGFAHLAVVDFCRSGTPIVAPGARLPDVFAPDWPRRATEHAAAICAPHADERNLLGWVTDDAPGWGPPAKSGRPSWLQICLSLEPGFATYHAAWEFVLALHGGQLEALASAWGVPLANKEVLRELTRAERGIDTRGYLRDEARWTREFARRYFTTTAAAIRAADPHHLVFGCRFGPSAGSGQAASAGSLLRQGFGGQAGLAGAPVIAECNFPAVDVALVDWNDVATAGTALRPVLAGNVGWNDATFGLPTRAQARGFTSLEWMLRRARATLARTARHPAVVGYMWGQWQDEPGEQPPFGRGLVHGNGAEAREHTELLAQFNARAESLRGGATNSNFP